MKKEKKKCRPMTTSLCCLCNWSLWWKSNYVFNDKYRIKLPSFITNKKFNHIRILQCCLQS